MRLQTLCLLLAVLLSAVALSGCGWEYRYTVTPTVGLGGSISPDTAQTVTYQFSYGGYALTYGVSYRVMPDAGYVINREVGGTCPAGEWDDDTYTTGILGEDCSVSFSFIPMKTVTPTAGPGGSISPDTAQTIKTATATAAFLVTPDAGYTFNPEVGGTCPQGIWYDESPEGIKLDEILYITGAVTEDCSVSFSFIPAAQTWTVTPAAGPGGSISPDTAQTVNDAGTVAFTVTPDAGYAASPELGGTCPQGIWNDAGDTYTTGAVTADCSVSFNFFYSKPAAAPANLTAKPANLTPVYKLLLLK